ncbi:hypothetical protein WL1483_594 [Aeromonas schubertii]|uniref:Uncharacterized protein n=1 Tax=Aeromonas schubertii TaxID=652 RepID=A0A0S2SE77_9GAMM|nr:hypothetical protein WL1483_594 [Aeromonas schubertii]
MANSLIAAKQSLMKLDPIVRLLSRHDHGQFRSGTGCGNFEQLFDLGHSGLLWSDRGGHTMPLCSAMDTKQ